MITGRAEEPHPLGPEPNAFDIALRKKRLMTLNHLFLVHRYKIWSVHYVSPTDDNRYQAQKMEATTPASSATSTTRLATSSSRT